MTSFFTLLVGVFVGCAIGAALMPVGEWPTAARATKRRKPMLVAIPSPLPRATARAIRRGQRRNRADLRRALAKARP